MDYRKLPFGGSFDVVWSAALPEGESRAPEIHLLVPVDFRIPGAAGRDSNGDLSQRRTRRAITVANVLIIWRRASHCTTESWAQTLISKPDCHRCRCRTGQLQQASKSCRRLVRFLSGGEPDRSLASITCPVSTTPPPFQRLGPHNLPNASHAGDGARRL